MKALEHCEFYAEINDDGRWVGLCKEWPDIRSKPVKDKLDAIDAVIDKVSKMLRRIHLEQL